MEDRCQNFVNYIEGEDYILHTSGIILQTYRRNG